MRSVADTPHLIATNSSCYEQIEQPPTRDRFNLRVR